jgi:hypothetical protein
MISMEPAPGFSLYPADLLFTLNPPRKGRRSQATPKRRRSPMFASEAGAKYKYVSASGSS